MNRRALLASVGGAAAISVAGCTTIQWHLQGPDSSISLLVGNGSEREQSVSVTVELDGRDLLDNEWNLDYEESLRSDRWDEPGEYSFGVETDEESVQDGIELTRADLLDCNSHTAGAWLGPDGEIDFWIERTDIGCP